MPPPAEIADPEEFLQQLRSAETVKRYWITFSRPNAFDVDALFTKPTSLLLEASDGKRGKTEIEGDDLDRDNLALLTRSAVATGNNAGALLRTQHQDRFRTRHLKGNNVTVLEEAIETKEGKANLLQHMRAMYARVMAKANEGHEPSA